jgi:hypothetical protein
MVEFYLHFRIRLQDYALSLEDVCGSGGSALCLVLNELWAGTNVRHVFTFWKTCFDPLQILMAVSLLFSGIFIGPM